MPRFHILCHQFPNVTFFENGRRFQVIKCNTRLSVIAAVTIQAVLLDNRHHIALETWLGSYRFRGGWFCWNRGRFWFYGSGFCRRWRRFERHITRLFGCGGIKRHAGKQPVPSTIALTVGFLSSRNRVRLRFIVSADNSMPRAWFNRVAYNN